MIIRELQVDFWNENIREKKYAALKADGCMTSATRNEIVKLADGSTGEFGLITGVVHTPFSSCFSKILSWFPT